MSAKRREETIRRFSVPIVGEETAQQGRPSRSRGRGGEPAGDVGDDDDDGGSDFEMNEAVDDDDSLDDEEDSSAWSKKAKTQKKGKGKAKPKAKATSAAYGSAFSGENPRVMLISLKGTFYTAVACRSLTFSIAGALGLNLTVANNVYL